MNTPKITPDQPRVLNEDSDKYGRLNLVELVRKSIQNHTDGHNPSVCYGIFGKWGEGKTSFLKSVHNQIGKDTESVKVIWFSPWMLNSEEALLKDFFDSIGRTFTGELKFFFDKYGNSIIAGAKVTLSTLAGVLGGPIGLIAAQGANNVVGAVKEGVETAKAIGNDLEMSLLDRKKEISKMLVDKNQHLIIIIDDIDRLDKNEIHAVFRLVRQVADFDNTIYLLSMDQEIVAKSLGGFFGNSASDGHDFIDKIVQVPIVLPVIPNNLLKKQIKEGLFPLFSDLYVKTLDELSSTLSDILLTPRLVIRYLNQIAFIGSALKGEVNIVDLCKLEALKLISPQAHLEVYRQRKSLLKVPDWLNYHFNKKEEEEEIKKRYNEALDGIVHFLPNQYRITFRGILDSMFSQSSNDSLALLIDRRVQSEECFPIYFLQAVPDGTMTNKEIKSFNASLERKNDIISELNSIIEKYEWGILNRLITIIFRTSASYADVCSKMSKLCKNLIFVDEREDDEDFSLKSHSIIKMLDNYMVVSNNPGESVVYDDKLCSDIVKYIYASKDFDFCIKFNAHLDRIYSRISSLEKDYSKSLLDAFFSLSYEKQLSLSQFELMGLYSTMYRSDENAPSKYLSNAINSGSFDAYTFFAKLILPELNDDQIFCKIINIFKKDNVLGLLIGNIESYVLNENQSNRLKKFSSTYKAVMYNQNQ